jgi:uncharacterized tellurite resistance protein B-like protein
MLNKLRSLLAREAGSPRLTELHPEEQVAVTAILLEVAESGTDFGPEEREMISALLQERFELDAEEVRSLIALTQEARAQSADLWPFTNAIARQYGPEQKERLLEMVWRVIFADGRLDPYEEQLTRRLQAMLTVNHSVLIDAKLRARDAMRARNHED